MLNNRVVNTEQPITGGCLCEKIKFTSASKPKWISVCHCRRCQRAYGNTSAIFVAFEKGDLELRSGSPKFYQSSKIAKKGLCSECGSQILFSYKTLDAVFVGNLDDPEYWQPISCHLGIESQISCERIFDDLPRYRTEDDPTFIEAN